MIIGIDGAFVKGRRPTDRASLEIITGLIDTRAMRYATANWANTPGGRPQIHRWSRPWRHEPPDSFQSRFKYSSTASILFALGRRDFLCCPKVRRNPIKSR